LLHLCPACRRQFDEAGFCPFDGTSLLSTAAAHQPTLISNPALRLPAQPAPRAADPSAASSAAAPTTTAEIADAPTARAGGVPGIAPDVQTQLDARRTFPLTPNPAISTGEITNARTRPGPGPQRVRAPSDPPKVHVQSASDNPSDALELLRSRDNEYDRLIGQTLDGRYYVERKIGEGGMGVVFAARHAVIERPLAIKVLKREAMRDTATIRRFVQEAKAASRIGHPNIVDVTDFGTTPDGMTYSVMEFVDGQTLGTALRLGAPFPQPRAMRITAQIARALAAAHDKGIVHRDLKPENVFLLDRDGRPDFVKIVDFGIAKVTPPPGKSAEPRLTRAGSVFGTPEYMAPEQAAGRSDTDGRVDIYALGVLLYEMICGRVPHRGDSMVRTLAMQMLDPIEPPSRVRPDLQITPELEAIVMHALVKKREHRYQTMSELLEALDAILPPPIGQSVTGSPVYTLAALPPGADPGVVPAMAAMPLQSAEQQHTPATQPGVEPYSPRATPAPPPITRRIKDEPQFTADDRPLSFEHVFTDEFAPARPRRWPLLLLFGMIAGGAAGAVALVLKSRNAVVAQANLDASTIPPSDAEPVVVDAVAFDHALDAGVDGPDLIVEPPDAGRIIVVRAPRDAAATVAQTPNGRGTIVVQVLTKPEGAYLYDSGGHYRGPGGAQLEEPFGTRMQVTCRQAGYKPGIVELTFDGEQTAALCVLKRIKICINNVKNPFDDCEVDPALPSPQAPDPTTP
jgi:serine/threonine protein kinase